MVPTGHNGPSVTRRAHRSAGPTKCQTTRNGSQCRHPHGPLSGHPQSPPPPPPFCGEKKSNLGQQSRHLQCVLPFDLSIRGPRRMEMYLGEQPLTAARWLTEKEINKSDHQTDFPSAVGGGGGGSQSIGRRLIKC